MGDLMVRKTKRNAVILAIVLAVISLIFICQYTANIENKNTITAMNAFATSEFVAKNHSRDSVLCYVTKVGDVYPDGSASGWRFYYISHTNGSLYLGFDVTVCSKENTRIYEYGEGNSTEISIEGWTIDSDEAYSIAMKNEKIKAFMNKYDDAGVDSFYLSMPSENSTHPVWTIAWVDWGFIDDPHWAKIQIDATTGEVLYVEAHIGSEMSTRSLCTICGILLILSPAVIIARQFKRRNRREEEKKRLEKVERRRKKEMEEVRRWYEEHEEEG